MGQWRRLPLEPLSCTGFSRLAWRTVRKTLARPRVRHRRIERHYSGAERGAPVTDKMPGGGAMIASMRSSYLKSEPIREQPIGSPMFQKGGTRAVWAWCSFGEIESLRKAGRCPSDPGGVGPTRSVSWLSLGLRPSLKAKCPNHLLSSLYPFAINAFRAKFFRSS